MNARVAMLGLAAVFVCGCGDDRTVAGTDEHGNALAARVQVRDSSGAPAAGVLFEFRPTGWLDGDALDTSSSRVRCVTDARGSCDLPEGGAALTLRAGDGEYAASGVVAGRTDSVITLELRPTGSVQGRIVGAGSGLVVRVPGLAGRAWTDDSGRFSLGSLPEGFRRLVVGSASALVLDSLPVRSRSAIDFQVAMPNITSGVAIVLDTFALLALPPTPVFSTPAGAFASAFDVSFPGLRTGEAVETSEDGVHWAVLNGSIRVTASSCIMARTVRDGRIVSNISKACYELAP